METKWNIWVLCYESINLVCLYEKKEENQTLPRISVEPTQFNFRNNIKFGAAQYGSSDCGDSGSGGGDGTTCISQYTHFPCQKLNNIYTFTIITSIKSINNDAMYSFAIDR